LIQEKGGRLRPDGERTQPSSLERSGSDAQELHTAGPEPPSSEAPPRPRRRWWIWFFGGAGLIVLFLLLRPSGQTPTAQPGKQPASPGAAITTGVAQTGDMNIYIQALGTVTPLNTVTVYSQITGRVMAVHYREGQTVHEGDPLIDVDPRPYEATLQQAQGTLDHDRGLLAEARIDLDRYRAAYAKNGIRPAATGRSGAGGGSRRRGGQGR
jgi:multidrug efflux system membrane fusion protein